MSGPYVSDYTEEFGSARRVEALEGSQLRVAKFDFAYNDPRVQAPVRPLLSVDTGANTVTLAGDHTREFYTDLVAQGSFNGGQLQWIGGTLDGTQSNYLTCGLDDAGNTVIAFDALAVTVPDSPEGVSVAAFQSGLRTPWRAGEVYLGCAVAVLEDWAPGAYFYLGVPGSYGILGVDALLVKNGSPVATGVNPLASADGTNTFMPTNPPFQTDQDIEAMVTLSTADFGRIVPAAPFTAGRASVKLFFA